MKSQLLQRVKSCPNLPSMPAIAVEVLELTKDDSVDISQIAELVSRDPAMAAKILKTANSSFYGCSQRVATMSQALMIMGLNSVKTLILGFSLVNNLSNGKSQAFDHRAYWKRSIYAATAARSVAARAGVAEQEEAFLAALLADIGMLVLDLAVGEPYGAVTAQAASHEDLAPVEAIDLGGTHAEVGGMIAEKWRLPLLLTAPIARHHDRDLSAIADPAVRRVTQVVRLSGRVADVFVDADPSAALVDVRRLLAEMCNLTDPDVVDALMADIGRKSAEAAGLFELNVPTEPDFEDILERADEAMVELTVKSQQQATQLAAQNQKLQVAATTDGLTGLANRAQFDAVLAHQFNSARQVGRPLSLLLMDVDKFKSVNDRFGHPTGDAVLRAIAKLVRAAARPQDLAARYGGEEICLVMPDTPRATAAAVAEVIRNALAARPVRLVPTAAPAAPASPTDPTAPPAELAVTASVGVATYEPGCPLREPAHLLKAADLAVYAAKKGGRNCVRVFTLPAAPAPADKVA